MGTWGQRQTRLSPPAAGCVRDEEALPLCGEPPGFRAGWEAEAAGKRLERPVSGAASFVWWRVGTLGGKGLR